MSASRTGEELHAATLRGDFAFARDADAEGAWAELIACERALALGEPLPPSTAPETAAGAWRLAAFRARIAVTGLDPAPLPAPPAHPVGGPLVQAWAALGRGDARPDLEEATGVARQRGWPALVVELTALSAMLEPDRRQALRLARRASRMGRTESLPQAEYLAGIVLARLRRETGYPHLAARILESLRGYASPHWSPWIDWELALAGGTPGESPAARAIVEARAAAIANDPTSLDAALDRARAALKGFLCLGRDAESVATMLRPTGPSLPPEAELPFAALAGDAFVVCEPTGLGRRVRAASLPLLSIEVLEQDGQKQRRIATLASALGLAGGSLPETECFERVYGFRYVPEMHRGSFDVLLHRARSALDGLAALERVDGVVRMQVAKPFAVRDPRLTEPVEARVLRAIAAGGTSAKAIADATGLSLRQTQILLKGLAEEGECVVAKEGRALHYRVEDTTFSEPTRVGVHATPGRNTPGAGA